MTTTYDPKLHKIVPIEPTDEMLEAACLQCDGYNREYWRNVYLAMCVVAPKIESSPWQDISTAPKDGVYDVIVENKYRLTDIKFKDGNWLDMVFDFDGDFSHYEKVENVTHWMPRPNPPEN